MHSNPGESAVFLAALLVSLTATPALRAADVRDSGCLTTAECQAQADKLRGTVTRDATSGQAKAQDIFHWFGRINMASTLMNAEEGIIPKELVG